MKNIFLFFIAIVISTAAVAQRNCGTVQYLKDKQAQDPGIEARLQLMNEKIQQVTQEKDGKNNRNVIRIPVVVHVVYKLPVQNISDAQIQSQIDVLNEDYRRLNVDASLVPPPYEPLAADCQIEFCLASRDPNGQATNGITRTLTTANTFSINDAVKRTSTGGKDAWPTDKYLNIWVCNLTNPLLGFATIPGSVNADLDGVVIAYKYFGRIGTAEAPYNKGRTATHEVGHWLNLLHIWGDDEGSADPCGGTDQVTDTPNQEDENYGCPTFPQESCGNDGDMSMNYMDYVNDACMYMFTTGQGNRMRATLENFRSGILTSSGCLPALAPSDCDTLNNITGGDGLVYYFMNEIFPEETGYLTGNNSLGYQAFAEKYTSPEVQIINSLRFDFAIASTQSANTMATAVVWDATGPNGSPGNVLAQNTFSLEEVIVNVDNFSFTDVYFPEPPTVNGDYYVGFILGSTSGDTLVAYCNQIDKINTNTAWCRTSSGDWLPFSDPEAIGQAISLAVRPVQCIPVSVNSVAPNTVKVYPNPAEDFVTVVGGKSNKIWQLFSVDGRMVNQGSSSNELEFRISTSDVPSGVYLLKLQEQGVISVTRILVSHP
jgi:hypothetical protein